MSDPKGNDAASCPVDHTARAAWLEKAAEARRQQLPPPPLPHSPPSQSTSTSPLAPPRPLPTDTARPLSNQREISTIPRAPFAPATATPDPSSRPSNHEQETGSSPTGNWIYPSEKMFFEAMKRKNYSPHAPDMTTIVPIHNAVNERAWKEIKGWESRFAWSAAANARCGGPRLASFSGDSSKMSPKARINGLLGYQKPFDRHDWVVERCGPEDTVEYVIDFYQGRDDGRGTGLSFYLDVRPKLNSWEGCKMRLMSLLGW